MAKRGAVSRAVRRVVLTHPAILDTMAIGAVNFSAVARLIAREVSDDVGEEVDVDTIKAALIRFSSELRAARKLVEESVRRIIAASTISLQTDVAVVRLKKPALSKLSKVAEEFSSSRLFQITQGVQSLTVTLAEEDIGRLRELVGDDNIEEMMRNQSVIILVSPRENIETVGFLAYLTSTLARRGVNVKQILSSYEETIMVFDRDVANEAYRILESLILRLRKSAASFSARRND